MNDSIEIYENNPHKIFVSFGPNAFFTCEVTDNEKLFDLVTHDMDYTNSATDFQIFELEDFVLEFNIPEKNKEIFRKIMKKFCVPIKERRNNLISHILEN